MRATRSQVLPLLVLLVCMFGCKAGQVLRVAGAVALTAAQIAAHAAAASARENHRIQVRNAQEAEQLAEGERRAEEAMNAPGQCTELRVEMDPPAPPGSAPPPRAAECGGNILIQNEEGRWKRYNAAPDSIPGAP